MRGEFIQSLQGGGAFAGWLVPVKMRASAHCPLALVGIPNVLNDALTRFKANISISDAASLSAL